MKTYLFRLKSILLLLSGILFTSITHAQIILTTQTITTNQIYNQPVFIAQGATVTIEGATVTFNFDATVRQQGKLILNNAATVRMGNNRRIILNVNATPYDPNVDISNFYGGRLLVNSNSVITSLTSSPTGALWQGIECFAPGFVSITGSADPLVKINNGTIQYAQCAYTNFNPNPNPNPPPWGYIAQGRIYAENATFKNNVRAMRIWPGWFSAWSDSLDVLTQSSVYFKGCTFMLTTDFPYDPPDMIYIAPPAFWIDSAYAAQTAVFQSCSFIGKANSSNYNVNMTYNTTAINVVNGGFLVDKAVGSAEGCIFMGLKNGIVSSNSLANQSNNRSVIANSSFMCRNAINISGDVSHAFIVNNFFFYTPFADNVEIFLRNCTGYRVEGNRMLFDGSQTYNYAGIIAMNSGTANNAIYRNLASGGYKQALQSIGTNKSMTGLTGLKMMCNELTEPYWDDSYDISVMTDVAGNGNNGIHNTQSFIDQNGQEKSAANKFAEYLNPLPANALNYYLQPGTNPLLDFKYKYFQVANNSNYELPVSRNFNSIVASPLNSCPVINTRGPQPSFPYYAYPTPPKFGDYVSHLQLIEKRIDDIENMSNPDANDTSQLEVLYDQQSSLIDSMASYYREQGLTDSLILTYKYVTKNYHYQLMLAMAYAAKRQYDAAYQTLLNISGNYPISYEEGVQIENLTYMGATLQWLRENQNDWANLPDLYKEKIYDCESKDPMYAGAIARALLVEHEGYEYDPIYVIPEEAKTIALKNKLINRSDKIYPNPAHTQLFIDCNEAGSTLELLDIFGRKMGNFTLQQGLNSINISGLAAGIYIARIKANNKTIYQQKIVKQ